MRLADIVQQFGEHIVALDLADTEQFWWVAVVDDPKHRRQVRFLRGESLRSPPVAAVNSRSAEIGSSSVSNKFADSTTPPVSSSFSAPHSHVSVTPLLATYAL